MAYGWTAGRTAAFTLGVAPEAAASTESGLRPATTRRQRVHAVTACGDDAGVPDWKRRHPVAAFRVVALSFVILPAVVFGFAFGWMVWAIVWVFVAAFFVSVMTKWGRR